MSFDKHWDEKELMLKGLLNHPYKDLGKFKIDDFIDYILSEIKDRKLNFSEE